MHSLFTLLLLCLLPLFGAEQKPNVMISGNEMQYATEKAQADVLGDAHAQREIQTPEGKHLENLFAHRFEVFFLQGEQKPDDTKKNAKKADAETQNVDRIKAFDNVRFENGSQVLTADKCDYNVPGEMITCYGNVYIQDKGNKVRGDEGEINLKTRQYKVRKTKNCVKAMIIPSSQGQKPENQGVKP